MLLRTEGHGMKRKTSQRAAIEEAFHNQNRALGIEEILHNGRVLVESLNLATVYRNLKLLVEKGWLRQIHHPLRGTLYERTGKAHHHHFHCHACNRVFELPGCSLDEETAAPEGFVVENHEIFLCGICPSCGG
jgi:Fur family transcriptional regulator, ferric uptake regulator